MTSTAPFRHRHYDAVVVGARCAGAATAMLLARAGARVLMVDRQPYGSDTLSTHALMRGGVLLLSRWGVLPAVVEAGTPRITSTTFRYGREEIRLPIKPDAEVDGLYAPRRTVIDPILVDAAWSAGAEVHHGVALHDLVVEDGRVAGVVLRDLAGGMHEIRAGVVVGADGIGSTVARRAGAQTLVAGRHSTAVMFAYVPDPGIDGFQWGYEADAGFGGIPTNDGMACVFVGVPTPDFDAGLREDVHGAFASLLARHDPALADHVAACGRPEIRVFRGRPGHLRQAFGPGWALVGDAGFFRDPITAHGITDALRDADGLARAIVAGGADAMEAWRASRDAVARPLLEVTDAIAAFDRPMEELQALHKDLSGVMKAEVAEIQARPYVPAVSDAPARTLPEVA